MGRFDPRNALALIVGALLLCAVLVIIMVSASSCASHLAFPTRGYQAPHTTSDSSLGIGGLAR